MVCTTPGHSPDSPRHRARIRYSCCVPGHLHRSQTTGIRGRLQSQALGLKPSPPMATALPEVFRKCVRETYAPVPAVLAHPLDTGTGVEAAEYAGSPRGRYRYRTVAAGSDGSTASLRFRSGRATLPVDIEATHWRAVRVAWRAAQSCLLR